MDIRTKLVFTFVAVALLSMIVMGIVVGSEVADIMRDGRLEQLDELAESRRQELRSVLEGWRDRADAIAGRTLLRAALEEHGRTGSAAVAERIRALLDDAFDGLRAPTLVRVYSLDGAPVATVSRTTGRALPSAALPLTPTPPAETQFVGVELDGRSLPQVTLISPMTWDERPVGSLVATFEARGLAELASSYQGLGDTGEIIVLMLGEDDVPRALHPTRHDPSGTGMTLPAGGESLAARALSAEDPPPVDALIDYRGEVVWAATRFIADTGWGLIVKVDAAEEARTFADFASWLRRTALILAAFAILAGFAFGMRFALPIHALAEVANRIRGGDMKARAKVTVEDEVGALTRDFNAMADELEQRMEELHEFQKFFDVSIDLMCIAGTDGYFKRVNPAFKKLLGWSEEALVVRPFYDFVHPDDVEKTEREVDKLAVGIPTISFDNRFLKRDGSYALLRWTSYPEAGRLYAIAHVIEESTPG